MAVRISRRKLSEYVAERLVGGDKASSVVKEVAAFLIDTRRTREVELLVRDIESALAKRGIVVADVTSAHPLTDAIKQDIRKLLGGRELALRETVDLSVLGGIRLSTPEERLDATLKRKIQALKA